MYLEYYLNKLDYSNMPNFLKKYLSVPSLNRLKKIGYFCGMDYASKDIYNFSEHITRYDHSVTVALITYKLTKDKTKTLAGLFHDIATPCFSHVIDYMNKDYDVQESTEEFTEKIILNDKLLLKYLKEDNINVEDIINFKKFSIVDNNRPKVCADRIDGVILNGFGWTKSVNLNDIKNIIDDIILINNESNEEEIGFLTEDIAKRVIDISKIIDIYCHSKDDNYMMEYLAKITKYSIKKGYIKYDDLYILNEEEIFYILKNSNDYLLNELINKFETMKKEDIELIELPKIKIRNIKPIVNSKRIE